jgi:hypothetical protein
MKFPRSPFTTLSSIVKNLTQLPGLPNIDYELMLTGIMLMEIIDRATEPDQDDTLLDPTQVFALILIAASEQSKKGYPLTKTVKELAALIIEEEVLLTVIQDFPVEDELDRCLFLCTAGMFDYEVTLHCSLVTAVHQQHLTRSAVSTVCLPLHSGNAPQVVRDIINQPRLFGWIITG